MPAGLPGTTFLWNRPWCDEVRLERFARRLPGPLDLNRQADSGLARQFKYGVTDFSRQSKIAHLKFLQQGADVVYVLIPPGRYQNAGQTGKREPGRSPPASTSSCTLTVIVT